MSMSGATQARVRQRSQPPFRADHVGSLLRPGELAAARAARKAGTLSAEALRAVEDRCIQAAIRQQEALGLRAATDGEYRRAFMRLDPALKATPDAPTLLAALARLEASAGHASKALAKPGTYSDANITSQPQAGGLYEAVLSSQAELKYGSTYEFRVRLADLAGGGPRTDEHELNEIPSSIAARTFRRFVAPKRLTVTPTDPQDAADAGSVHRFQGHSFSILRPRLGYPALLFTELDTATAFARLEQDRNDLHSNKPAGVTINDYRDVSYFDPDVDQMLVAVDVKTLAMDNQASDSQREPYLRLYTAIRRFDPDLETPFELELSYRDVNVIDMDDPERGDLDLDDADIADGTSIVLPRSRDIRITLYPVCSIKPQIPAYFGFEATRLGEELHLLGEPTEFFVREDADDEVGFFAPGLESHQLQGIRRQRHVGWTCRVHGHRLPGQPIQG